MKNPPQAYTGSFVTNDQIPTTLDPIFKRIFQDQFPVLQRTVEVVQAWIKANPKATKLPRKIGKVFGFF